MNTIKTQSLAPSSTKLSRVGHLFLVGVITLALFVGLVFIQTSEAAVNVFFSNTVPTSLQNDLIAGLTTQYNGTLTPSYQAGSYYFTVTSKKAVPLPGNCLVDVSSEPFTYGYVFGEQDCRTTDIGIVNKYLVGYSTYVPAQILLSSAAIDMYTIMNGTPTVVVPPGQ